jgi:GPH family glycoside/pentoside/hexuronide:cation symporter
MRRARPADELRFRSTGMSTPVTRAELGSLRAKLFYGFGSIAFGIKDFGFGQILLFYYNKVIGLQPWSVSLAIAAVLCVDAVIDPVIGQVSDNLRTKLGRRHPLMYAAALPVAVSYFFLWTPPHGWSQNATLIYLFVMATIVRFFISMYEIPSSAMVPEMTDDYDARTSFISIRYVFGVAASVLMNAATFGFLLYATAAHPDARTNPAGYTRFALASAVIMVVSILISARGTQRYIPLFRAPPARRPGLGTIVREGLATLAHGQFLIVFCASMFGAMAIGLAVSLGLYFNTYFWAFTTKQVAALALAGLPAIVVPPLLAWPLSQAFGKKNAALGFYFFCVVLGVVPMSLRLLGLFPGNGSSLLFALVFAERAVSLTLGVGCLILFGSMVADVVEDNAVRTGRRSEGLLLSAMSFVNKLVSAMGLILAGLVLQLTQATATGKSPASPTTMAEIYLPLLLLLYGIGIVILSRYRISRAQHEENVRLLTEAQAEAAIAIVGAPPS